MTAVHPCETYVCFKVHIQYIHEEDIAVVQVIILAIAISRNNDVFLHRWRFHVHNIEHTNF